MGVFDVSQLCVHFLTGLFTVIQYEADYVVYKVMGTIISGGYETWVFVTVILAFNRFVLFCFPAREKQIFSSTGNKIWLLATIAVYALFAGIQASSKVYSKYLIDIYQWKYDYSYAWSRIRKDVVIYYQLGGVFVAWLFYIAVVIKLFRYRNEAGSSTRSKANQKLLIHAFVITVYCTIQNFLWHKIDVFIPEGKVQNVVLNMMWVGNGGLSTLLCLILNQ
ncbi:hypothetical protein L596_026690 [Steinernema carpocapsae]|uniref:7TM GPCR serpentine receptor class x (Srx) domain-containing protein n=1 Tax=Steinernema carpocapsae TaxID=34508 RepID=A0A4U5M327_STECR|nr:hypothetical protein L596_026690 [Steinernema carpocapsae]